MNLRASAGAKSQLGPGQGGSHGSPWVKEKAAPELCSLKGGIMSNSKFQSALTQLLASLLHLAYRICSVGIG